MSSKTFDSDVLTRPNHFEGQVVKDDHLLTEQDYMDFLRMVNNYYFNQVAGVLVGLTVAPKAGAASTLTVARGLGHYVSSLTAVPGISMMQEVCVLKSVELDLTTKLNATGDYQLVATTKPTPVDPDLTLNTQYHYMRQIVDLNVISNADTATGLVLCKFHYDVGNRSANVTEQAKILQKPIRTINTTLVADGTGNLNLDPNTLISIINQATTTINQTRITGMNNNEFTTLVNLVNSINEKIKQMPRFKEVRG